MASEKCAGGSKGAMTTTCAVYSFAHASQRFVGDLCAHFLPLFQKVVVISKAWQPVNRHFDRSIMMRSLSYGQVPQGRYTRSLRAGGTLYASWDGANANGVASTTRKASSGATSFWWTAASRTASTRWLRGMTAGLCARMSAAACHGWASCASRVRQRVTHLVAGGGASFGHRAELTKGVRVIRRVGMHQREQRVDEVGVVGLLAHEPEFLPHARRHARS